MMNLFEKCHYTTSNDVDDMISFNQSSVVPESSHGSKAYVFLINIQFNKVGKIITKIEYCQKTFDSKRNNVGFGEPAYEDKAIGSREKRCYPPIPRFSWNKSVSLK